MGADPHPDEVRAILDCQRSMMRASPYRPEFAYFLKVQRRVRGIRFEQIEIAAGFALDGFWKLRKRSPEARGYDASQVG